MISFIDQKVGEIINYLEESGEIDNTVIIFTADHGEMHGHHDAWGKGHFAYDDCQRVPFLIWGPNVIKKKGTTQALASLVDLPRTILELTGCEVPQGMQGVDLTPILQCEKEKVQDAIIVEMHPSRKIHQETMVTDNYKLVVYEGYENEGELYDMKKDPEQYINLWNKPECSELKAKLLHKFIRLNMQREGKTQERSCPY